MAEPDNELDEEEEEELDEVEGDGGDTEVEEVDEDSGRAVVEESASSELVRTDNIGDVTGLSAKDEEEILGTDGALDDNVDDLLDANLDDVLTVTDEDIMGRKPRPRLKRRVRLVRPSPAPPTSLGGVGGY